MSWKEGDTVKDTNPRCTHYGAIGKVVKIGNGRTTFVVTNDGDKFKKGDKLTQDRFSNLMSYMYSFLIKPKKFEDHMKFNYFTSKKLTTDSSIYLIIQ